LRIKLDLELQLALLLGLFFNLLFFGTFLYFFEVGLNVMLVKFALVLDFLFEAFQGLVECCSLQGVIVLHDALILVRAHVITVEKLLEVLFVRPHRIIGRVSRDKYATLTDTIVYLFTATKFGWRALARNGVLFLVCQVALQVIL
jgi:hypothetical protein